MTVNNEDIKRTIKMLRDKIINKEAKGWQNPMLLKSKSTVIEKLPNAMFQVELEMVTRYLLILVASFV